jgi:hypothetical protein
MTERRVSVRLTATGGQQVKAELQGIGTAGEASLQRTTVQVDRLNRSFATMGGSGGGLRQASMQLSQVAQQTMATGNFVQALSIQLPDLMLGFGTFGIAAGVAAGALLPLIANMVGAGDQAKTLDDALTEAADAINTLKSASETFTAEGVQKAIERYGRLNAEIERLIERQTIVARNDALATLQGTVGSIRGEIDGGLLSSTNSNVAALLGVENRQRAVNEQVLQFRNLLSEIEASQGLEAQADAVARMLDFLDGTEAATSQFYSDLVATEAVLREAANRTGELDALMGQATDAAGRFAATDLASGVAAAADQAARLRRILDQQRADSAVVLDPRDPRFDADRAAFAREQEAFRREQDERERFSASSVPRVSRGGGGGGGGRSTPADPLGGYDPEFLSQVAASVSGVTSEVDMLGEATQGLTSSAGDAFVSFVTGAESAREALKGLLDDLARVLAQSAFNSFGVGLGLPGFANGTPFAPGGLAIVGERGPEIVNLPRGSRVYSNEASRRMGGAVTVAPVFNLTMSGGSADDNMNAMRQRLLPEIERVALAAVRNAQRRGL